MNTLRTAVLIGATLSTGMLAGLYYGWAISVMPGLNKAQPRAAVDALQQMNVAIVNPAFMLSFLGAPLLSAVAVAFVAGREQQSALWWVLAAAVLNLAALISTFVFNIPLNNRIDQAGDPAALADPARVWDDFATPWMVWHWVRTVACTVAFGFLGWALVLVGKSSA